jgi:hypothetical protein
MSYISDFLGGTTLQAPAGAYAIAANDILALAADGMLYPAQVTDYAAAANVGTAVVPSTSASGFLATGTARDCLCINPVDASIFLATAYITANDGVRVSKYTAAGALYGTVNLDTTAAATTVSPCVFRLSDGHYVAVWGITGSNIKFAIFDEFLNIVVAATAIDALDAATKSFGARPLTGGGFAVAYSKTNPFLAIYDNAGSVVHAGAALQNAAAFGVAVQVAIRELQTGNLAIAIASATAAKTLGHAVVSNVGANVVQCTLLDTGGAVTVNDVCISAMSAGGFYAVAMNGATRQSAYVLSNAGALQGGGYAGAIASALFSALTNDGTQFWWMYPGASSAVFSMAYIPSAGAGFVTTTVTSTGSTNDAGHAALVCDRGYIYAGGINRGYTFQHVGAGKLNLLASYVVQTPSGTAQACVKAGGDFTLVRAPMDSSFAVYKTLDASVLGVSQVTLAAGNAGTAITVGAAAGDYLTSTILGRGGVALDHTASNIVGQKGVLFKSSINLKGVGA